MDAICRKKNRVFDPHVIHDPGISLQTSTSFGGSGSWTMVHEVLFQALAQRTTALCFMPETVCFFRACLHLGVSMGIDWLSWKLYQLFVMGFPLKDLYLVQAE